jgi:CPA2 family monovalent cation:H+ antiporter-2
VPHDTALIAMIAVGIGLAFVLALIATRLRLPVIVGYILAGVVIGPFTPGYIANAALAQQLSEIGVILLMFGVGIHFSLGDLLAVRRIALPGAVVQIAVATLLGTVAALWWGWSWGSGIVFGLCLSVASTVVLLRAMESRGMLDTTDGRIAVGWLIVEDLATVLVLVLLPALAVPLGGRAVEGTDGNLLVTIAWTLGKVTVFVALMFVVGRRLVPWLLERVASTGSREMFTLAVLAVALGIAFGAAALFDVSFALGAFLAGMVVNSSDLSHEAATDALPLQDAFSVLFFVAVGMLFDPSILIEQPLAVLAVVLIVMIGKSLAAFVIVLAFRYPVRTALTISASLAQIGEFSFILAALALHLGLLPPEGQSLIVAGAILSISLNAAAFGAADALSRWIARKPRLTAALERGSAVPEPPAAPDREPIHDHAIVVGFGRVGSAIGEILAAQHVPLVLVDHSREHVLYLREQGYTVVFGDAARPGVLEQASPDRARLLVIALPDPYQARAIIDRVRRTNDTIEIIARAHGAEERAYLEDHGANLVLVGEHELAFALAHHALLTLGRDDDTADAAIDIIRRRRVEPAAAPPT